jgi:hypothetical protein
VTVNWETARHRIWDCDRHGKRSHVYRSPGTFDIVGTATDSFGNVVKNSISVSVNPKPQPLVSITVTTANPTAGVDMVFKRQSRQSLAMAPSSKVRRSISAITPRPSWRYWHRHCPAPRLPERRSTLTVTLTATDSNGGVGTAVTTVLCRRRRRWTVLLSSTSTPAGTSTAVTFTATVIGLGNSVVVDYQWDLPASLETRHTTSNTTSKTYPALTGTITVTVTITTSTGARQSGQTTLIIP